jgi:hypothetical protein
MANKKRKSLAEYPHLLKEWHKIRNGELLPDNVSAGSHLKVWWICDRGHEWRARIESRTLKGNGCPACAGQVATPTNNMLVANQNLALEWHPTRNGGLKPNEVTPNSNKKVWWICERGHEWEMTIKARNRGKQKCPYCSWRRPSPEYNLAVNHPYLAQEWHPIKNGKLTAYDVTPGSERKVWWLGQCGHEWEAPIKDRKIGNGCPFCAGKRVGSDNNLAVTMPELAKEWHPLKNNGLTPEDVSAGSRKRIWWLCEKGHEWQTKIGTRKNGSACPYCGGKKVGADNNLAFLMPDLAKEWHPTKNGERTAYGVTQGSAAKVWWICKWGHEWQAGVKHRVLGTGCPFCSPQTSRLEIRILCELRHVLPGVKWRESIGGEECDILLSQHKIGIEIDGLICGTLPSNKKGRREMRSRHPKELLS